MIVGRDYILQSLRNGNRAYRPATNALSAELKAYTRPVAGIIDYVFKLEMTGNDFLFKHVSTGYYLTENGDGPGSAVILSALVGSGSGAQRWSIEGGDNSARISSVQSSGGRQITLLSDSEGYSLSMQPYGGVGSADELVSFNEYSAAPSGVVAPVLGRVFKNFTACTVTGVLEGATVRVYIDDVVYNTVTNVTGGSTSVSLGTLQIGQRITADQTLNSVTSSKSSVEYVQELARVWQEGFIGNVQYRAYKVNVTSVPDRDNIETIVGTKGEPIGGYKATFELALSEITTSGLTETTY